MPIAIDRKGLGKRKKRPIPSSVIRIGSRGDGLRVMLSEVFDEAWFLVSISRKEFGLAIHPLMTLLPESLLQHQLY